MDRVSKRVFGRVVSCSSGMSAVLVASQDSPEPPCKCMAVLHFCVMGTGGVGVCIFGCICDFAHAVRTGYCS